jgi:hypothetical protein
MDEDPELQKKIMKGFNETKDFANMICKILHTDLFIGEDLIEDITDPYAY